MQNLLRNKIESLFGLPAMKMPWSLYMAQLNEAGKLTERNLWQALVIVLESIEDLENKETEVPQTKTKLKA